MYWITYADLPVARVDPDVPTSCSICCSVVRADEMWGTQKEEGDEGKNGGWVVCSSCHSDYVDDSEGGQNAAQIRWDTFGPCKVLETVG